MSSFRKVLAAAVMAALGSGALAQASFPGIGRAATPKEVAAWDIDVRPDFLGLPPGRGKVSRGMDLWEAKCAACHGTFGESNQTFSPLVGGTTAEDVKTGRVARLMDPAFPGRTTLMKVATVSTLWDYIHRAMPWTAPKSLTPDEVYALTAYLLNLGGVLPDDFELSDQNIRDVQQRLPNRNGITTDHGLWPGKGIGNGGKPDVRAKACMKDCAPEPKVASTLPDFARNAHGNLAEQNRLVGPQRGALTTQPSAPTLAETRRLAGLAAAAPQATASANAQVLQLLTQHNCTACHGVENRIVGPSFRDVAKKHGERPDAAAYLAGKIRSGGQGLWGDALMPPQTLPDADNTLIARWLAAGASR